MILYILWDESFFKNPIFWWIIITIIRYVIYAGFYLMPYTLIQMIL